MNAPRISSTSRAAAIRSENGLLYGLLNTLMVYARGLGDHERDVIRTVLYRQESPVKRTKSLRAVLNGLLLTGKLNDGETRIVSAVVKG